MKPARIDRHTLAGDFIQHAIRWCAQYGHDDRMANIAALAPYAEPDVVDDARGYNTTWSSCSGCKRVVAVVVRVGDAAQLETADTRLCRDCLIEALELAPEPVEVKP